MNTLYTMTLLWIAVIWPLLLSNPFLHSRLPWPRHLAIIPAAILAVIPVDASINIPWLLYGTGFAIDENVRWILGAFVVIWFAAITIRSPSKDRFSSNHSTTLYLLTLTGSLGALLTTGLVGFFSFSTLMGYSFYAVIIQHGDKTQQRAGNLYLYFLIVADIVLFEALLLAGFTNPQFQYEMAHQTMSEISASPVYLYMVLIGFALKAGIWPFYFWLTSAFNSGSRTLALLLIASPITISLVGIMRWLPLREDIYISALVMQLLGAAGILHSVLKILFKQNTNRFNTAWLVIAFTGLFSLALGTALQNPALWQQYSYLAYPLIAVFSLSISILIITTGNTHSLAESTDNTPGLIIKQFDELKIWFQVIQRRGNHLKHRAITLWHKSGSFLIKKFQHVSINHITELFVTNWKINITLFLILGLTLSWLAS